MTPTERLAQYLADSPAHASVAAPLAASFADMFVRAERDRIRRELRPLRERARLQARAENGPLLAAYALGVSDAIGDLMTDLEAQA